MVYCSLHNDHVSNHHPAVCIKKFVVFHVCGDVNVGFLARAYPLENCRRPRTKQLGLPACATVQYGESPVNGSGIQGVAGRSFIERVFQFTHQAGTYFG
jgi:hypothetical protein